MASYSINTMAQVNDAITATYLTDAVIGVAFIVLIIIIANLIAWQPGANDNSPAKRRTWFWILGVCTLFISLGVNVFVWMSEINPAKHNLLSKYTTHMIIAAIVSLVIYGLITWIICKMQKKDTKLASMF